MDECGPALLYPSTISISDVAGVVSRVTVTLSGLHHTYPADLDVLLVSPTGTAVLLMSQTGTSYDVTNVTLRIADGSPPLPSTNRLVSGTYAPTDYFGHPLTDNLFPSPAPPGPYGTALSALSGINPTGVWSLYVRDAEDDDTGVFAGGWGLEIELRPVVSIYPATEICWSSQTNSRYQVEWAPSVDSTSWTSLGPAVQGTGSNVCVFDSTRSGAVRFYQVRVVQ